MIATEIRLVEALRDKMTRIQTVDFGDIRMHLKHLGVRAKYFIWRHYWWVLILVAAAMVLVLAYRETPLEVFVPAFGGVVTLFHFVQRQKLVELKEFRKIFDECNQRYEDLRPQLADRPSVDTLTKYFNLCAEEYLYFQLGYIHPNVWQAWREGIRGYLQNDDVRAAWNSETVNASGDRDSFYGLVDELSPLP